MFISIQLHQKLADFEDLLNSNCDTTGLTQTEANIQRLESAFEEIGRHWSKMKKKNHLLGEFDKTIDEPCYWIPAALKAQVTYDGDRLVDLMSMPLKNAAGKDVSSNYTSDMMHIKSIQSKIADRIAGTEQRRDTRKLRLKQILHLSTCERDAQQVKVARHKLRCYFRWCGRIPMTLQMKYLFP